jgi:hypothetical protein
MVKAIGIGMASILAGFILLAINQLAYAEEIPLALEGYDTIACFESAVRLEL